MIKTSKSKKFEDVKLNVFSSNLSDEGIDDENKYLLF